jgi:AcrR family transcriptional regulator
VRLDVDERREQLLELGLKIFGASNYEAIAIDDIAERAGISKGLLYHYFASKRGFYVAVVRHAAAKLRDSLEPDPSLPPLERARTGLERYLEFVEARAEAYVALMRSGIGSDPEVFELVEETRVALVGKLVEGAGISSPSPLTSLALRAWIGAVEAASLEWLDRRAVDRATLIALLLKMLVDALTTATADG